MATQTYGDSPGENWCLYRLWGQLQQAASGAKRLPTFFTFLMELRVRNRCKDVNNVFWFVVSPASDHQSEGQ